MNRLLGSVIILVISISWVESIPIPNGQIGRAEVECGEESIDIVFLTEVRILVNFTLLYSVFLRTPSKEGYSLWDTRMKRTAFLGMWDVDKHPFQSERIVAESSQFDR